MQVKNRSAQPGTVMAAPGGGWVTVYQDELRVNGSPAWRNNNPGNLEKGPFANAHGAIGGGLRFAVFPDEATGMAAIVANLNTSLYQNQTILDAMKTWAPPTDPGNNPVAYANTIRGITGLEPSRKVSTLNDNELTMMAGAIKTVEGWEPGITYTRAPSSPDWARRLLGTTP